MRAAAPDHVVVNADESGEGVDAGRNQCLELMGDIVRIAVGQVEQHPVAVGIENQARELGHRGLRCGMLRSKREDMARLLQPYANSYRGAVLYSGRIPYQHSRV